MFGNLVELIVDVSVEGAVSTARGDLDKVSNRERAFWMTVFSSAAAAVFGVGWGVYRWFDGADRTPTVVWPLLVLGVVFVAATACRYLVRHRDWGLNGEAIANTLTVERLGRCAAVTLASAVAVALTFNALPS